MWLKYFLDWFFFFKICIFRWVCLIVFLIFNNFFLCIIVLCFCCNLNFFFSCCNFNLVMVFLILVFLIFIVRWVFVLEIEFDEIFEIVRWEFCWLVELYVFIWGNICELLSYFYVCWMKIWWVLCWLLNYVVVWKIFFGLFRWWR